MTQKGDGWGLNVKTLQGFNGYFGCSFSTTVKVDTPAD